MKWDVNLIPKRDEKDRSIPSGAFPACEDVATTPGKAVHKMPLYRLIQYTPT